MTAQFARTPYRGRSGGSSIAEPHAALLIDFDNVTMGIRSDLTKELKNLLNSDIIKGKVAVQRAYADWRRYPQYIVPLAESSVDLIFAPAYGSAKKNATDIRLAIDALELVFTRSEIGTFILLSGDSDFSSLVLKLKEYGKYVIGVGIRESASDLLVQNCDEYYSYSALTGLTRAGEEAPVVSEDPWELVELALKQMIDNDDVMRSDRLKQVLLEMDPTFDEKALGFQKFNKFLQEAATRGLLSLRKQDNGQFEVGAPSPDGAEGVDASVHEPREGRRGRRGRGRGRRDEPRPREEPRDQLELSDAPAAAAAAASVDAPADTAEPTAAVKPAEPARETRAATKAPPTQPPAAVSVAPQAAAKPEAAPSEPETAPKVERAAAKAVEQPWTPRERAAPAPAAEGASTDLKAAYALLRRAASDLVRKNGPAVRDSDVKRRMLELEAGWDETSLGFSKFSRFLRQAHDAEVVTLRKLENGNYDVLLSDSAVAEPEEGRSEGRGRRDRGRGRGREERGPREERAPREEPLAARAAADAAPVAPAAPLEDARPPRATQATPAAQSQPQSAPTAPAAQAPAAAFGFRRGSRGRGAPSGPPPLLEGQAAMVGQAKPAPAAVTTAPATTKPEPAPAREAAKAPAKKAAKKAAAPRFNAGELGLPRDAAEVTTYIATNYKGVGPKSVQALIEKFGAGRVFEALETKPDAVRDVMGTARGDRLLEAWSADVSARRAGAAPADAVEEEAPATPRKAAGKSRGRRGGRRGQTAAK
jgi:uncharacterized protein (TIGR00288 family)